MTTTQGANTILIETNRRGGINAPSVNHRLAVEVDADELGQLIRQRRVRVVLNFDAGKDEVVLDILSKNLGRKVEGVYVPIM